MTQDNWQDCPTLQSVAAALDRGDYIEVSMSEGYWEKWSGKAWRETDKYRCRPVKKVKTVEYWELEFTYAPRTSITVLVPKGFLISCRYTGNEITEEVPE